MKKAAVETMEIIARIDVRALRKKLAFDECVSKADDMLLMHGAVRTYSCVLNPPNVVADIQEQKQIIVKALVDNTKRVIATNSAVDLIGFIQTPLHTRTGKTNKTF